MNGKKMCEVSKIFGQIKHILLRFMGDCLLKIRTQWFLIESSL